MKVAVWGKWKSNYCFIDYCVEPSSPRVGGEMTIIFSLYITPLIVIVFSLLYSIHIYFAIYMPARERNLPSFNDYPSSLSLLLYDYIKIYFNANFSLLFILLILLSRERERGRRSRFRQCCAAAAIYVFIGERKNWGDGWGNITYFSIRKRILSLYFLIIWKMIDMLMAKDVMRTIRMDRNDWGLSSESEWNEMTHMYIELIQFFKDQKRKIFLSHPFVIVK